MNRKEFEEMYKVNADEATDTGCPFVRTISVYDKVYFVAEEQDPCPLRKCKLPYCRNYGNEYDNPDRLIII